jgi:hypothetical protein
MATVEELKAKIAAIEAEIIPLRVAHEATKVITNQAQAAIDALANAPGRTSLSKKIAAQKALEADPTNPQLQLNLQNISAQFSAQIAELAPLLAARDAAYSAQIKAGIPIIDKEDEAAALDLEIAKIDPTQASPEAIQYLKENSGVPVTSQSDPALPQVNVIDNPENAGVTSPPANPNMDPNTNIGEEVQVTGFEPLKEPPNTEEDEFSGIDEQIQRQKDIEDGTAEFAGIDEQIAINENTLQEPPLLNDEEVEAELNRVSEENQFSEENNEATNTNVVGSTNSALNSNPAVTVTPYKQDDWRIRLSLAGSANYLYKIATKSDILYPLIATDGVVFPYTPVINSSYRANYDPAELTHSNYKMFFYKNSSVDDISITAEFTAQDTAEANYMLAVIHFFKSATKMFYGQDASPRAGTPPPLLYLTGYGLHQFQKHPLLLTSFSYNLPNDVDYIRAGSNAQWGGVSIAQVTSGSSTRLGASGLVAGGGAKPAAFSGLASQDKVTYVPTKISLTLSLSPVVTRNDISKNFSLKDYAAGKLSAKTGGGIW